MFGFSELTVVLGSFQLAGILNQYPPTDSLSESESDVPVIWSLASFTFP